MILDAIKDFECVSVIGLDKNTGKTTTLNYMIKNTKEEPLGLTSIGRDGEATDLVTSTYKPKIYVKEGTIIATTTFCLGKSDISKEILETTGINTSIGEVVLVRARSSGYVEIAGPSTNADLKRIIKKLKVYSKKIYIDGALSRKSLASPAVADSTIIATGGAVSSNIDIVVDKTELFYNLISSPPLTDDIAHNIINGSEHRVVAIDKDYNVKSYDTKTAIGENEKILQLVDENTEYLYVKGAVTDKFTESLFMHFGKPTTLKLVIDDGTKIFISGDNYARLNRRGIKIKTLNPIKVCAITVNPTSPFGYTHDKDLLVKKLSEKINVDIFNIWEE